MTNQNNSGTSVRLAENIIQQVIQSNDEFPNNPILPLLLYRNVLFSEKKNSAGEIKKLFLKNNWTNSWTNGIYDYDHYHSNTHEVLGIANGGVDIIIGGPNGTIFHLQKGDALIIPAGVAHRCIKASSDFKCVGAYPYGTEYDIMKGNPGELEIARHNIEKAPMPDHDPVFGNGGPLIDLWKK